MQKFKRTFRPNSKRKHRKIIKRKKNEREGRQREKEEQLERERIERERLEQEERERKEREKQERQERKRLEREQREKEKQERERIEREERERIQREEKERKERERQERFEKRRLEREQRERELIMEGVNEFDTPKSGLNKLKNLTQNNSIEKIRLKKNVFNKGEEEKASYFVSPKNGYHKKYFSRFNMQSPEASQNTKEDYIKDNKSEASRKSNQNDGFELNENNILEKPIKKIYVNKKQFLGKDNIKTEGLGEEIIYNENQIEDMKSESGMSGSRYEGQVYEKKRLNLRKDNMNGNQFNTEKGNKYINIFKNKAMKYDNRSYDDEYDFDFENKNATYKDGDYVEAYKKGRPTKIKIYKCVVWKNTDPSVNEDTIKSILRKSGSQIFEKGGFVVKLPQKNVYKKGQGMI